MIAELCGPGSAEGSKAQQERAVSELTNLGPGILEALLERMRENCDCDAWIIEVLAAWSERSAPAAALLTVRLVAGGDCVFAYRYALTRIGLPAIDALERAYPGSSVEGRLLILDALSRMRATTGSSLALVRREAFSTEERIRARAALALSEMTLTQRSDVFRILLGARLPSPDYPHQLAALASGNPREEEEAARALLGLARSDEVEDDVRSAATTALGSLSHARTRSIPLLREILRSDDEWLHSQAATSLLQLGDDDPEAIRLFQQRLDVLEPRQRLETALLLARGGPNGQRAALGLLEEPLRSAEDDVRLEAARLLRVLARIDSDTARQFAESRLDHEKGEVRVILQEVLSASER